MGWSGVLKTFWPILTWCMMPSEWDDRCWGMLNNLTLSVLPSKKDQDTLNGSIWKYVCSLQWPSDAIGIKCCRMCHVKKRGLPDLKVTGKKRCCCVFGDMGARNDSFSTFYLKGTVNSCKYYNPPWTLILQFDGNCRMIRQVVLCPHRNRTGTPAQSDAPCRCQPTIARDKNAHCDLTGMMKG